MSIPLDQDLYAGDYLLMELSSNGVYSIVRIESIEDGNADITVSCPGQDRQYMSCPLINLYQYSTYALRDYSKRYIVGKRYELRSIKSKDDVKSVIYYGVAVDDGCHVFYSQEKGDIYKFKN